MSDPYLPFPFSPAFRVVIIAVVIILALVWTLRADRHR
jgi:hypothetical protein